MKFKVGRYVLKPGQTVYTTQSISEGITIMSDGRSAYATMNQETVQLLLEISQDQTPVPNSWHIANQFMDAVMANSGKRVEPIPVPSPLRETASISGPAELTQKDHGDDPEPAT
jgi:hypothetical protein